MTEDTSPENLRKFLESDDPAMVRMGISMAKGTGVPDDLLGEILWMYMLHDDKTIRAAAKSTFTYLAPNKLKEIIKNNWKASYRKLKGERFAEAIGPLVQASNSQKRLDIVLDVAIDSAWRIIESSVKAAQVKPRNKKTAKEKTSAVKALGHFGTTRAIEPLIKALMHNEPWWAKDRSDPQLGWRIHSAIFLGNIGKSGAVKPLTSILTESPEHSEANWYNVEGGLLHHRNLIEAAAEALGKIGDTRGRVTHLSPLRMHYT